MPCRQRKGTHVDIAASMMVADGAILESEEKVYQELVKQVGISKKKKRKVF